jgi:UDP-3-O-[3-hydroxymyristoyl] glucosamine N-acyltransferase
MSASLGELAERFELGLHGPAERRVTTVGTLATADVSAVAFFANPLYRAQLGTTRAGAVVLHERDRAACPVPALVAANPYAAYARIAGFLHPLSPAAPGIHASASVAGDASVADSAEVQAHVCIGSGTRIGPRCLIGAGSIIGAHVVIEADTRLAPRVVVLDRVHVGARCLLHSGAVVGADGFGFAADRGGWIKVPQLGSVMIGNDVEIGANTAIDRGTIENTVIGDGVKLDNLIQIAHNVRIGAHTVMAGMSGIAGSTRVGERCLIGGAVSIIGHLEICDDVTILVRSVVTRSIKLAGTYSGVLPADEAARWRRKVARFNRLDGFEERLRRLEQGAGAGPQKRDKDHG